MKTFKVLKILNDLDFNEINRRKKKWIKEERKVLTLRRNAIE